MFCCESEILCFWQHSVYVAVSVPGARTRFVVYIHSAFASCRHDGCLVNYRFMCSCQAADAHANRTHTHCFLLEDGWLTSSCVMVLLFLSDKHRFNPCSFARCDFVSWRLIGLPGIRLPRLRRGQVRDRLLETWIRHHPPGWLFLLLQSVGLSASFVFVISPSSFPGRDLGHMPSLRLILSHLWLAPPQCFRRLLFRTHAPTQRAL